MKKLTVEQDEEIIRLYTVHQTRWSFRALAEKFNVSYSYVQQLIAKYKKRVV